MVALAKEHTSRDQDSSAATATPAQTLDANAPRDRGDRSEIQEQLAQRQKSLFDSLQHQQEKETAFTSTIDKADQNVNGSRTQSDADRARLEQMGIWDRAFGTKAEMENTIAQDDRTTDDRKAHEDELMKARDESKQLEQQAREAAEEAKTLATSNPEQAQKLLDEAARLLDLSSKRLDGQSSIDVAKETANLKQIRESGERLATIASHIGTTEKIAETTRDGLNTVVVVGATIAGGTAAGAAANAALKGSEALAECDMDIALGNKTSEQACKELGSKSVSIGLESGMLLAAGGAGKLGGAVMGTGATAVAKIGVGAASGGIVNAAGTAAMSAWQVHEQHSEFLSQNASLKGEALIKAWDQYREQHGISTLKIAEQVGIAGVTGAAAGGVGSVTSGSILGKTTTTGVNVVTGAAQLALGNGHVTASNAFDVLAWSATGMHGGAPGVHENAPSIGKVELAPTPEMVGWQKVSVKMTETIVPKVVESIHENLSRETVQAASQKAAETGVAAIKDKALTEGTASVTQKFATDTYATAVKGTTVELAHQAKVPEIVSAETSKWLKKITENSVHSIAEELGIDHESVRGMKKMLKDPAHDAAIKDSLVENITDKLHEPFREKLLELGYKEKFMETAKDGIEKINDELESRNQEKLDEEMMRKAADEGFERGLRDGLEEAVREGVEEAFENFRNKNSQHESETTGDTFANSQKKSSEEILAEAESSRVKHEEILRNAAQHMAHRRDDGTWEGF